MNDWNEFETDRLLAQVRRKSLKTYKVFILPFIEHQPKIEHKIDLLNYLVERYPNPRTRKTALDHIRVFHNWRVNNGLDQDWMRGFRLKIVPAPPKITLTEDEFWQIMNVIPKTMVGRRDRAYFATVFYTGARRDAIRLLKPSDVNIRERWVHYFSKGKEYHHPLPVLAARELHNWMMRRPGCEWLFPSGLSPDRPICDSAPSRHLKKYAKAAGIQKRVWVHLLRHSHAQILIDAGVPLEIIKDDLGHAHISTTERYARLQNSRVREVLDCVFG